MRHVLVQPLGEFGRRGPRLGCILKNLPQPFQVLIGLRSDLAGNLPGAALDARIEQQQEAAGILSPEVKARLAQQLNGESTPAAEGVEAPAAGQTALFNAWEDAVECAKCGGRMVRTGSCYTCRDCGTNTGCS